MISLIAHASGGSSDTFKATTGNVDTTGADLLVICAVWYAGASRTNDVTISDSKSNSWTNATRIDWSNGPELRFSYCKPTSVGSGHNFTSDGGANICYTSLAVLAFSGSKLTTVFDTSGGAAITSGTTGQGGSLTAAENDALLISSLSLEVSDVPSIDSSYSKEETVTFSGGVHYGISIAWRTQTPAAAINPTWTWTNAANAAVANSIFKPFVGGTLVSGGELRKGSIIRGGRLVAA